MSQHTRKFKNIRVTNDGYQVVVVRAKIEISQYFRGHSRESLRAAEAFRDQILQEVPPKRLNPIPEKVLRALGRAEPVVGVFRHPTRQHYAVSYTDREGRQCSRAFSWRVDSEATAYAKAARFRERTLKSVL
jgi:hypothetical protein